MIKEYEKIDLQPLNTFGIAATGARMVEFDDANDLREIFSRDYMHGGRWNVLAGGSNVLFTGDYEGTLLHPTGQNIAVTQDYASTVTVKVEAGVDWDGFVEWTVENDLWGAENLSYIPGFAGSAPVQNIGAYGVEAKDIIQSVELYDVASGKSLTIAAGHCAFRYRDSVFKRELKGRVIITAVNFALSREAVPKLDYGDLRCEVEALGGPTLRNIRQAVTAIRKAKLPEPEEAGNAGSFFKNPVVSAQKAEELKAEYPDMPVYPATADGYVKLAAGWLIDRCRWRGRSMGRAGVHARQALVLVNLGGATGAEVLTLAARIRQDVLEKFDVGIEMEVNVW